MSTKNKTMAYDKAKVTIDLDEYNELLAIKAAVKEEENAYPIIKELLEIVERAIFNPTGMAPSWLLSMDMKKQVSNNEVLIKNLSYLYTIIKKQK